jgi:hypothetical protein
MARRVVKLDIENELDPARAPRGKGDDSPQ